MSFTPASKIVIERLKQLYYDDKFFVGRDRLWEVYHQKYKDHWVSQRTVLDWLKHQDVHQRFQKTLKKSAIRPMLAKKKGLLSLDCVQMPPFNGYNTLYNMVDILTKRLYSMPFKGQTASNTIKFFESILQKYPNIKISAVRCDNGPEYQEPWKSWMDDHGFKVIYSRPHTPWSNAIERYNGTLKRMLNMAMQANEDTDWVTILPRIVDNINSVTNFSTKKIPLDVDQSEDPNVTNAVAKELQDKASKRYKERAKDDKVQVGDLVRLVHTYDQTKISTRAAKVGYFGHEIYRVTRVVKSKYPNSLPSFKLVNKDTGIEVPNLVARWEILPIPEDTVMAPPTERNPKADASGRYEVESILDKRTTRATRGKRAGVEYLIKWRGYKKPSWHDARTIKQDVPTLVREYEKAHK